MKAIKNLNIYLFLFNAVTNNSELHKPEPIKRYYIVLLIYFLFI